MQVTFGRWCGLETQRSGCHRGHVAAQPRNRWTAALVDHVRQDDHVVSGPWGPSVVSPAQRNSAGLPTPIRTAWPQSGWQSAG